MNPKRTGIPFRHLMLLAVIGIPFILITCGNRESSEQLTDTFFPRLGNYADLYLRGSYDILHMIKARELGKIGQAAKIAAQRKMAGGKVISRIGTPHIMYAGACAADMPGNPNIAPDPLNFYNGYQGDIPLGAGDFLITANPNPHVEAAYRNDCFVLGIGFPMTTNRYSPPNFNDHPEYFIENMSNLFIYTWGPKEDGLVTPALTPHLKILPTSPMTVVAYWLVTAQLAHNLAYQDTSGSYQAAETYIDSLMSRLDRFHTEYISDINKAGEIIAEKVLAGGRIHPWSGRNEFWIESSGTAGGLMGVYPLGDAVDLPYQKVIPDGASSPRPLGPQDIVILAASDSVPDSEIAMAKKVRETGAWMIGIFPFSREDNISTEPLRELCDISLDNMSGNIYGILNIPGYQNKIIPTATMMNNFAFWAIVGAYVQAMEQRGEAPYYWMSYHVPGGHAYDDSIRGYFLERGY